MTDVKYNNLLVLNSNEKGNYVKLSEDILECLINKNIKTPYYFLVVSETNGLFVYVGVKEFTGLYNCIEIPNHISEYLSSEYINISLVQNIPKCKTVKVKINDENFLNIPEYDKFLENELAKYCILYQNQELLIDIMDVIYKIQIIELIVDVDNEDIICELVDIVNIDVNIDIITPKKEPEPEPVTEPVTEPEQVIESDHFSKLKSGMKLSDNNEKKLSNNEIRLKRLRFYDKLSKNK